MSCRPVFAVGVGILLLALGGCTREPEPVSGPDSLTVAPPDSAEAPDPFPEFARRATAIELGLDDYRRVESTEPDGTTFTAYLDGEHVRLIEETRGADATAVYYFAEDAPFYIVRDEPGTARRMRIAFGPDGTVVAAEWVADGNVEAPPPAEIEALWVRALALAARVLPPEPL